jgi:hypothetical protein
MESRSGQMELDTLVSGERIGLTVKANSFMLMAMFMKAVGKMTRPMGLEYTNT